jgi:short-subunit dehydrogenase
MLMDQPRSILVTGGSSGIGAALARAYAGPGVFIALNGRDQARLDEVADSVRRAGGECEARVLDVTDTAALQDWIAHLDTRRELDLVIANAGTSAGNGGRGEDADQTRRILAVNAIAVIETVQAALPGMLARGRGQIAIMASLAGFRGMPGSAAYGASKATVRVWGEAMRTQLADRGIGVSVICPGFVVSRMTAQNRNPMPGLMSAERAAAIIRQGLARNRARIAFPWFMRVLMRIGDLAPIAWTDALLLRAWRSTLRG